MGIFVVAMLSYNFWEIDPEHLDRLYSHVEREDLRRVRKEVAKEINYACKGKQNIRWLDIGSGNGVVLAEVLKYIKAKNIDLACVEPDAIATSLLRTKLAGIKKLTLMVHGKEFSPDLIPDSHFNTITLLHSVYFLGRTEEDYRTLFVELLRGLKKNGKIISVSISSKGDFNRLGNPEYSKLSLGDNLYTFLQQLGYNPTIREFPTRFNVTSFIREPEKTAEEFRIFYQFVNQNPTIEWNEQLEENFRMYVKDLAIEEDGKLFLDFKDMTIALEK